jgi:hypothetical protein
MTSAGRKRVNWSVKPERNDSFHISFWSNLPNRLLPVKLTIREKLLENESAELEAQASRLADEIKELSGEESARIN